MLTEPLPNPDATSADDMENQAFTPEEMAAIFAAQQARLVRTKKVKRAGYTKNKGVGMTKKARKRVKQSRRNNR